MNKNSIFTKVSFLYFFSILAACLAISIIYICQIDDFQHSILISFLYILLFSLIILVSASFKSGKKEIVKPASGSLLTVCLIFHAMGFMDMIILNQGFFFTGNMLMTVIALIAIIHFILFIFIYINHFYINSTSNSNDQMVKKNRVFLIILATLSILQAFLLYYKDVLRGKKIGYYLILSYVMFCFTSFIIASLEGIINKYREAREEGKLEEMVVKEVGKKAAKASNSLNSQTTTEKNIIINDDTKENNKVVKTNQKTDTKKEKTAKKAETKQKPETTNKKTKTPAKAKKIEKSIDTKNTKK